jgi:hypothetical protein
VVGHDIEKEAHSMLAQPLDKSVHFLFRAKLGVNPQRVGDIVSVLASAARFHVGGGIEVRDSEPMEIWDQAFCIGELEIRMKLNPVGCGGDLQSLLHWDLQFEPLARTSYPFFCPGHHEFVSSVKESSTT